METISIRLTRSFSCSCPALSRSEGMETSTILLSNYLAFACQALSRSEGMETAKIQHGRIHSTSLAKHFPVRREWKRLPFLAPQTMFLARLAKHFPVRREWKLEINNFGSLHTIFTCQALSRSEGMETSCREPEYTPRRSFLAKHFPGRREWKP